MKSFGKCVLILAVCVMLGGAVSASAYAPCWSAVAPVVAVPYGYVTTSVSVLPVTTAITYTPYVVTSYPVAYAAPVLYTAPVVMPRIVTVPTYAIIR